MKIGQLSKQTGFSIDAIRFYERRGLLAAPRRSAGGFRLYASADIEALGFVRQMQGLGFSLQEIQELQRLRPGRSEACAAVRDNLRQKLKKVQLKLLKLRTLQCELRVALRRCARESQHRHPRCPVLGKAGPGVERKRQ